jgi:Uma2 family endonuclease
MLPTENLLLELPPEIALHVTPEQFELLSIANRDLQLERTATGELIVNPPTGGETGYRSSKITYFLVRWIEEEGGYGIPFDSSTGFYLPNGAHRSPDAAWLTSERWESLSEKEKRGFIPLCPDFVVELRSPSDSLGKAQEKMREYRENGARLGWLIDPKTKKAEIYRPNAEVEVLDNPRQLSGADVLVGFTLDLTRVWA